MIVSLILVGTGAGGWDEALGAGLGFASVLGAFVGAGLLVVVITAFMGAACDRTAAGQLVIARNGSAWA